MDIYPEKLNELIDGLQNPGKIESPTVSAVSANLGCGTTITIDLAVNDRAKTIESVRFRTNGCGFMTTAGEMIARSFNRHELAAIGGFNEALVLSLLSEQVGPIPTEREHCVATAAEAFKKALSAYRAKAASEYNGESPLVCSCYGISEDGVNAVIRQFEITELSEYMKHSRAGTGCGSCRMIIEEMIDAPR